MVETPPKRPASASPDDRRSRKRLATSSPEEGELDDSTPPLHVTLPKKLQSPTQSSPSLFPFVKKSTVGQNGVADLEKATVVYERTEDIRAMIRERESGGGRDRAPRPRNGTGRRHDEPSRRPGGSSTGDHWEPSLDYGRDRSSRRAGRDHHDYDHGRYHSFREHDYPPRRNHAHTSRGRDRARSTPSPPSATRSHSSSTPTSTYRGPHRLPAHRTPEYSFSPPPREYNVDRRRDRERDLWEQQAYYDYDDHSYIPPYSRDWPQDSSLYHSRDSLSEDFRRYRPSSPDDRGRGWSRRRGVGSYRPSSPVPPSLPPRPSSPQSQERVIARTPPQPSEPPPPPPPSDDALVPGSLPADRDSQFIAIPLNRPRAPKDPHSPSPLPLPSSTRADESSQGLVGNKAQESLPLPAKPRKREPVQRSREEDMRLYGRTFEGCGRQSDYEITTKLGEGTFGEVHKAIQISTGRVVALKRILMHNESEGMPVTALREIKILKALDHPSIVNILDMFVVKSKGETSPLSVYMVFPYMDHDLAGLLENDRVKLQPSQIKLYMKQLLEGTEYMHANNILHRDMKAANLLISNDGSLRIADFGLTRVFDPNIVRESRDLAGRERKYTNCVVTRWYRPPELLLGARQYGGEVDMWGIGCVLGEMFTRRPILPGTSDLDQLDKIWQLCGSPNQHNWPNYDQLPGCEGVIRFPTTHSRRVKAAYERIASVGTETADLLDKMLVCNPRERLTASQALDHDYFWTDPLPADPKTLPSYEASHELDRRGRRQPPHPPPQDPRGHPVQRPPLHHRGPVPPPRPPFRQGPPPPYGYGPHLRRLGPGPGGPPPFRARPPAWGDDPSSAWDSSHLKGPWNKGHEHHGHGRDPINNWVPTSGGARPAHLPPRPAVPLGSGWGGGGRPPVRSEEEERPLNYG